MLSQEKIKEIEQKLNYTYQNKALLVLAFTHSSYGNLNHMESNERLEFLGDSILHFSTTQYLYNHFNLGEGDLSKVRSYVVSAKNLSKAIQELNVGAYLLYGKNDSKNIPNTIKANLFEAILASIYLDSDFETANHFVLKNLHYTRALFEDLILNTNDYKTKLQELIQVKKNNVLRYVTLKKEGKPHEPIFTVEVTLNDAVIGKGQGKSKKEAENIAAQNALLKLEKE